MSIGAYVYRAKKHDNISPKQLEAIIKIIDEAMDRTKHENGFCVEDWNWGKYLVENGYGDIEIFDTKVINDYIEDYINWLKDENSPPYSFSDVILREEIFWRKPCDDIYRWFWVNTNDGERSSGFYNAMSKEQLIQLLEHFVNLYFGAIRKVNIIEGFIEKEEDGECVTQTRKIDGVELGFCNKYDGEANSFIRIYNEENLYFPTRNSYDMHDIFSGILNVLKLISETDFENELVFFAC